MKRIPIYDASAPIACTLTNDEKSDRVETIARLRGSMVAIDRTDDGLLLHFPRRAEVEADLRRFAVDEKQCCQFWGFEVGIAENELTLRWDGPPEAAPILDRLGRFLTTDEPPSALAGLL